MRRGRYNSPLIFAEKEVSIDLDRESACSDAFLSYIFCFPFAVAQVERSSLFFS